MLGGHTTHDGVTLVYILFAIHSSSKAEHTQLYRIDMLNERSLVRASAYITLTVNTQSKNNTQRLYIVFAHAAVWSNASEKTLI